MYRNPEIPAARDEAGTRGRSEGDTEREERMLWWNATAAKIVSVEFRRNSASLRVSPLAGDDVGSLVSRNDTRGIGKSQEREIGVPARARVTPGARAIRSPRLEKTARAVHSCAGRRADNDDPITL